MILPPPPARWTIDATEAGELAAITFASSLLFSVAIALTIACWGWH